MRRRSSFTLVELVLVIVLTLTLTSLAIKGLRGIKSWRAAAGVARVQADLLHARNQALLSARRTLCVFDLKDQTYELRQESAPDSGPLAGPVIDHPLTGQPWQVALGELSSGLLITSLTSVEKSAFGFGPDGLPIKASGARITKDIDVDFNNGATLTIFAGSGLSEARWP